MPGTRALTAKSDPWAILMAPGFTWKKTITDMAGRPIRTEKPGPEGIEAFQAIYDSAGRIFKNTRPGMADMLYHYDETGRRVMSALDVNNDGIINENGSDRITWAQTVYEKNNGAWWHKATNRVFLVNGSNASTITGITREKLTGLEPGVISETHVADSHGEYHSQAHVRKPRGRKGIRNGWGFIPGISGTIWTAGKEGNKGTKNRDYCSIGSWKNPEPGGPGALTG